MATSEHDIDRCRVDNLMDDASLSLFATAPKGVVSLLFEELPALGAVELKEQPAGVRFRGNLETAYRICLWSRCASRVLLRIAEFPAATPDELYTGIRGIDWGRHLSERGTLAVDLNLSRSRMTHSHFAALKVKDAIVDQFRERSGVRPSVEVRRPDVRVNVRLHRDRATVSLDLSGESLHRRGYRVEGGDAPLKENLAAAILLRAGWPEVARRGGPLLDPMCGSGTLPIEAALMAADIAPGSLREYFGFIGWKGHEPELWQRLLDEARERREVGLRQLPAIIGYDADRRAVRSAIANVEAAGLRGAVHIERCELATLRNPRVSERGLLVVNPPYGERLGEKASLGALYAQLGERLRGEFEGWRAAVFTGNPELAKRIGIRARRQYGFFNGSIPCRLFRFDVERRWFREWKERGGNGPTPECTGEEAVGPGAQMFANRLRKNLRTLGRWARREGITCYRLYDADMPEYALAIDLYQGEELWVHVQEYEAPAEVDPGKAKRRLEEALVMVSRVLGVPGERIRYKVRRRQRGRSQYERLAERGDFLEVEEGGCRFLVNLTDYLDTGLFLDHRPTRALIGRLARGRHMLNLFAYTGSATVHAARGGAVTTTTVDLSRTYLEWARRNMALNGFTGDRHRFVQADCLEWLEEQAGREERYGLIFLDPPTFSSSKRMSGSFDVQRDHVTLIRRAARLLSPDGILLFSNNFRRFRMNREALDELQIEEITSTTLPKDFARNRKIHNCWKITRKRMPSDTAAPCGGSNAASIPDNICQE